MSKKILATVGVALLLVTAGCAGSFTPTADAGAQSQDGEVDQRQEQDQQQQDTQRQRAGGGGKTIRVSASGDAEAQPDQAVLRVAVLAQADDANTVREQIAQNVSQMREALREVGLSDDQIRTASFRIEQDYRREDGERRPAGFRGIHAFEITLSDVGQSGPIIDTAVSNGADRVDNVELTLSKERRREVRADALRDAMDNARGNADVIAESANLTITGVHTAATGDVRFDSFRTEAVEADAAGQARTEIESGPVSVSAQVEVTYNATG
jgi:uncharacterized protein YggE